MTTAATMAATSSVPFSRKLEEEIRCRAFEIYERRGVSPGNALQDWLQAETEILGKDSAQTPVLVAPAKKPPSKRK